MKKLLRVLLTVTVFFSVSVAFKVTNVSAATPTKYTLSDSTKLTNLSFFGPTYPTYGGAGTLNTTTDKVFVYKMGDIIRGNLDVAPVSPWKVELITVDGSVVDSLSVASGSTSFSIGTSNVVNDGKYALRISSSTSEFPTIDGSQIPGLEFYVQYNLTWKSNKISNCLFTASISGWITRGNGQPVKSLVKIYVASPNKTLATWSQVETNSSGYFSIAFPTPSTQVGNFYVYVQDGYSSVLNPDYDAMVYDTLSNVTPLKLNLSSYISPILLYKNQKDQPALLVLTDQYMNYISGASFTVKFADGTDVKYSVKEISKGFYRFIIDTSNVLQGDIRFIAHYNLGGTDFNSNSLIINLIDKGAFNPYVDINTIYSIAPDGEGPSQCFGAITGKLFDKLPCTVGNAFEVVIGYWPVADPANWHIYDISTSVDGPVLKIDENRYFVQGSGSINASINMIAWQRADSTYSAWNTGISEEEMAKNAVSFKYSKVVQICQVRMGGLSVSLSGGEQTDSTTIQLGKKTTFAVSIDFTGAPSDLSLVAPNYIIHIFMVNGCNTLPGAFTVDTYESTKKINEIWFNPMGVTGTSISDLPITFATSTSDIKFSILFSLSGISFNYATDTECGNHLIVQLFGLKRMYDACWNMNVTYPAAGILVDPIKVVPLVKTLSTTAQIKNWNKDLDKLLTGIDSIINLSDTHFTLGEPKWEFLLNGKPIKCTVTKTSEGYTITFDKPLEDEGVFKVYGYAYNSDCTVKEEVAVSIPVVKPADSEKPVIEASASVEVNTQTVTITGKVTDNIGVDSLSINAMKIDFAPDGTFSAKVELIEGANTIKITAFDNTGNMGEKDLAVTYKKTFTIDALAGPGGTISPSGTITVNSGDSKTFTIIPNSGYKISLLKVDGASKGSISSYTYLNIVSCQVPSFW